MEALARLPVFFALAGKRAVVAGGSAAAAWKAELLVGRRRAVDVYAPEPRDEMLALAATARRRDRAFIARAWQPPIFAGAALAVGAFEDDGEAARFAAAARARRRAGQRRSTSRRSAISRSARSSTARRW